MVKGENTMESKPENSARSLFTIRTTLAMLSMQSKIDYFMLSINSDIRELYEGGASYAHILEHVKSNLNHLNENY
jgi:hypothetical protein